MRSILCTALLLLPACLGAQPASGADTPARGHLDQLMDKADLVFKGQVVRSVAITNNAFRISTMDLHATQFKVISVLQGTPPGDTVVLQHYGSAPTNAWFGPSPPAYYALAPGDTCLVFAATILKSDTFYTARRGGSRRKYEFRQLTDFSGHPEDGLIRTLDARPLDDVPVKDAVWQELNLMLRDRHPSNELYAIEQLDSFSLTPGNPAGTLAHTDDFKRSDVLAALLPLLANSDEHVANRATDCFAEDAGILKANLTDADSHVLSVAKLAEKNAGPWLTQLTNLLQTRINKMNDLARNISDPSVTTILTGDYLSCWEDLRHYLSRLPSEKLADDDLAPCLNLLGSAVQTNQSMSSQLAHELYELYETKALPARAAVIRQKFPNDEDWFDAFDRQHPELKDAGH